MGNELKRSETQQNGFFFRRKKGGGVEIQAILFSAGVNPGFEIVPFFDACFVFSVSIYI